MQNHPSEREFNSVEAGLLWLLQIEKERAGMVRKLYCCLLYVEEESNEIMSDGVNSVEGNTYFGRRL